MGVGRNEPDPARERAMAALAERLDDSIRAATDRLIALHGLEGSATQAVLERMQENFSMPAQLDEGRAALLGSIVTGALTGLKADLAAGGLTFGAGMLVGGVVGGLAGAGLARGVNALRGAERPAVKWSDEFLDGLVRSRGWRRCALARTFPTISNCWIAKTPMPLPCPAATFMLPAASWPMNNEAELAGVLGHEIGHVVGRDSANMISQQTWFQVVAIAGMAASPSTRELAMAGSMLFNAVMLGYGREKEFLADSQGVEYMFRARI